MNLLYLPWLELALATTMIGSLFVSRIRDPNWAAIWAWTFTGAVFIATFLAWLAYYLSVPLEELERWSPQSVLFGHRLFSLDEFNAPLVPAVALLHFLIALATARTMMRRFSFSWSLAEETIRLATFSCSNLGLPTHRHRLAHHGGLRRRHGDSTARSTADVCLRVHK